MFRECPNCGNTLSWYNNDNTAVCDCCGYVYDGPRHVNGRRKNHPFGIMAALLAIPALIFVICVIFMNARSTTPDTGTQGSTIMSVDVAGGINVSAATAPTVETVVESVAQPSRTLLVSLDPYKTLPNGFGFPFNYIRNGQEDIFSNTYSSGIKPWYTENKGTVSATYRLNEEYSRLEFTLAIPKDEVSDGGAGSIYIYSNGDLIFSRPSIPSDYESEHVVLSLNHCQDLTIEAYASEVSAFETVSPMLCDPVLYR